MPWQRLCCETGVLCGLLVPGSIQTTGHSATILLHVLVSCGREPGPSADRAGQQRCPASQAHLGGHWPCSTASPRQQRTLSFPGPRKLGLGLTHSWHRPVQSKHKAEECKGKVLVPPWSPGSGVKLWGLARGGIADCPAICDCET